VPKIAAASAALLLLAFAAAQAHPACTLDRATGTTIGSTSFMPNAWGSTWDLPSNRIAFMTPVASGYYHLFTVSPDGQNPFPITSFLPQIPPYHQGDPSWYPGGRYLLFIAQMRDWHGATMFGSPDFGALPGFGVHDDMWLITADGKNAWQLTSDANTKRQGILLPIFSPDGKEIVWTQRQPDKSYIITIADFSLTPVPHLSNFRYLTPGHANYYETGSFSSDGKTLFYTSDQDTNNFWLSQIFALNLQSSVSTRLTFGQTYNEHPIVAATPTGDWVIYMSTKGLRRHPGHFFLGTEFWAMRPDGSGAKRLTGMNVPGDPEYTEKLMVAGNANLSPDGTYLLASVQNSLVKQTGEILKINFTCE